MVSLLSHSLYMIPESPDRRLSMETKEMTMKELIAFINSMDNDTEFVIHVEFGEGDEGDEEESL